MGYIERMAAVADGVVRAKTPGSPDLAYSDHSRAYAARVASCRVKQTGVAVCMALKIRVLPGYEEFGT